MADIVFIVDSSGSINEVRQNWPTLVNFIRQFVQSRSIGPTQTQIGLVEFSNDAFVMFGLDRYSTSVEILSAVDRMRYIGGRTDLAEGMNLARTDVFNMPGNRNNAKDIAIVITDGIPNENEGDTIPAAQRLKQQGVTIIAVGITDLINENELRAIASSVNDVILTPNFDTLNREIETLTALACPSEQPGKQQSSIILVCVAHASTARLR